MALCFQLFEEQSIQTFCRKFYNPGESLSELRGEIISGEVNIR